MRLRITGGGWGVGRRDQSVHVGPSGRQCRKEAGGREQVRTGVQVVRMKGDRHLQGCEVGSM